MYLKKWIKRFKKLPTPLMVMHITGKVIVCFGLGILFADYLTKFVWWIILLGVILTIPSGNRILTGKK